MTYLGYSENAAGVLHMTVDEIMDVLRSKNTLIVPCSHAGKREHPVYPDDLRQAIAGVMKGCCGLWTSVVWPAHTYTYGAIGIILRPRSEVCRAVTKHATGSSALC
jgi:hypothetical protein